MLVSYFDESEIYIYDEVAAEQEPDFKRYFYEEYLKEMKQEGKTVIVITHDDRYFDYADTVYKFYIDKMEKV